jgi:hypothetical protein
MVCAVCGAANASFLTPAGLNASEPPDFDTRPGEPLRSSLATWVQCCSSCGYCADDISRAASEDVADIVRSDSYRSILSDESLPVKARQFLTFAFLLSRLHRAADAGWSALHAAWACDDLRAAGAAMRCRAEAIDYWKRGKQAGQLFSDDMATEFALVTDLYRRMGDFEHATVACAEGLDLEDIPLSIEAVLRRQVVLIHARDTEAHSMSELLAGRSSAPEH